MNSKSKRSSNIYAYRESVKNKIDNDSFIYVFKDTKSISYSRSVVESEININGKLVSFYNQFIMPLFTKNKYLYTLYKNKQGVWMNYSLMVSKFPSVASYIDLANNQDFYHEFSLSTYLIPEVDFVDADKKVHPIERCDGIDSFATVQPDYIDEGLGKQSGLKIEQYSLDNPDLDFSLRHLMNDLKVTITEEGKTILNSLVWLNGLFVNVINDVTNDNVFYIENGKHLLTARSHFIDDNGNPIYHYDIDIRIFKWKNTQMTNWIEPSEFLQDTIIMENRVWNYISSIQFSEEIDPDSHFIMCDGRIMNTDDYEIDINNPKQINLLNIRSELSLLLYDILKNTVDEYTGLSSYNSSTFFNEHSLNKSFSLINLSHENSAKKIFVQKVKPIALDFPEVNSMIFRKTGFNDLVLVEGYYIPYSIDHRDVYKYPNRDNMYISENVNITSINNIYKIDIKEYY